MSCRQSNHVRICDVYPLNYCNRCKLALFFVIFDGGWRFSENKKCQSFHEGIMRFTGRLYVTKLIVRGVNLVLVEHQWYRPGRFLIIWVSGTNLWLTWCSYPLEYASFSGLPGRTMRQARNDQSKLDVTQGSLKIGKLVCRFKLNDMAVCDIEWLNKNQKQNCVPWWWNW